MIPIGRFRQRRHCHPQAPGNGRRRSKVSMAACGPLCRKTWSGRWETVSPTDQVGMSSPGRLARGDCVCLSRRRFDRVGSRQGGNRGGDHSSSPIAGERIGGPSCHPDRTWALFSCSSAGVRIYQSISRPLFLAKPAKGQAAARIPGP